MRLNEGLHRERHISLLEQVFHGSLISELGGHKISRNSHVLAAFQVQGASGTAHSLDMAADKSSNTSQVEFTKYHQPNDWLNFD